MLQRFGWEWSHFTPITDIVTLMNHVLTKNNFTFLDKHYLQVHGTAMGTRMAPSMACLLGKLEECMLASDLVALYRRHILHLDQWCSRSTLCPEVTVHQRSSSHQESQVYASRGYQRSYFLRRPRGRSPTRDCANKKIPLVVTYHPSLPAYVRLPVLTTISSTPEKATTRDCANKKIPLVVTFILLYPHTSDYQC